MIIMMMINDNHDDDGDDDDDDGDDGRSWQLAKELETALMAAATATRSHTLTPIKRGGPFERYYPTAGEFLFIIMFTEPQAKVAVLTRQTACTYGVRGRKKNKDPQRIVRRFLNVYKYHASLLLFFFLREEVQKKKQKREEGEDAYVMRTNSVLKVFEHLRRLRSKFIKPHTA